MSFVTSKRILAVLLLLCMVFGLLPAVAFADGETAEEPVLEEAAEAVVEEVIEPVDDIAALQAEAAVIDADAAPEAVAAPEAESYKLTFHPNYSGYVGPINHPSVTVAAGTAVDLAAHKYTRSYERNSDGTYSRFVQIGWSTSSVGSSEYDVAATYTMPAQDVELYAVWETLDQYHWEMSAKGPGQIKYQKYGAGYNSEVFLYQREGDDPVKLYVDGNRQAFPAVYSSFSPEADEGYIFDGWYVYNATDEEKLDVTVLTGQKIKSYKLTNDILEAGRNKIVANFIENDGSWASVKFLRSENGYEYYSQMVKIGSDTPDIGTPVYDNHYFLGWSPEVSKTVTGDVVYVAQWLEGPTAANTATNLYTIRCVSDVGLSDTHKEMSGSFGTFCTSNDDIAYDEARGVYTCSVSADRIGTLLGVGGSCFNVYAGQEHEAVDNPPVINLVWDASANQWKPDGEQVVEVTHKSGDEEITADDLKKLTKIICVVDYDNPDNYKSLDLLNGTYEIVYTPTTGNTRTAEVRITNFDTYASKLGFFYTPDWEHSLPDHNQDYYVFYMTRSLKTASTADQSTYYVWSDWNYDKLNTVFQSTGGVKHNENLYGKELMVSVPKVPTFLIRFVDGLEDEEIFRDYEYETEAPDGVGQLPYWDCDDPYAWSFENVGFNPDELQLPTGEIFYDWDPVLPDPDYEVTEDMTFTAVWDRLMDVVYLDGYEGEVLFGEQYFQNHDEMPPYWQEDGSEEPSREGYVFAGWKSIVDEEATGTMVDEATGYTVNVYEDEGYTSFAILLEAQWQLDADPIVAKAASLYLDGTIGLNFKVTLPDYVAESETAQAVFLYKGAEHPVSVQDAKRSGDYYVFTYRLTAAEFANSVGLKFVDGDDVLPFRASSGPLADNTLYYSGQRYSEALPASNSARKLIDMLHSYCHYAYLGLQRSEPDVLPSAIVTNPAVSSVTAADLEQYKNQITGSVTGLSPNAISLNLLSATEINIKLSLASDHSIDEYSFKLDGKAVMPVYRDNLYVITVHDIPAMDLDRNHTLVVTVGDETLEIQCCALGYCYTVLNGNLLTAEMQDTCRALYLYNQAANEYFDK